MPMTYSIDVDEKLVYIVGHGRLTDEEMVDCVRDLRSDPMLQPDMNVFSDMRAIEMGFTPSGIRKMLDVMVATEDRRSEAWAALVVARDVTFGMARMLQSRAREHVAPHIEVFRDVEKARDWLEEHRA
ncbi:MAG: hypothetical protein NXI30_01395 [bacterium]|nr:hypothetical protein [bacterium]